MCVALTPRFFGRPRQTMAADSQKLTAAFVIRPFPPEKASILTEIGKEAGTAAAWTNGDYQQLSADPTILAFVSEWNGSITGFIVARQVADQAEVLNLAVRKTLRRQGHGSALLKAVLQKLRNQRARRVFLEVRHSNRQAVAFYAKHGFQKSGIRKAYYQNPDEDALCMEVKLT